MNRFVRWAAAWISIDSAASSKASPPRTHRLPISLVLPLLLVAAGAIAQGSPPALAPSAITQLQQLGVEKQSRTPAQRKLDSQLLYASRVAAGTASIYGTAPLMPAIAPDANGRVAVDIRVPVDAGTLALVTNAGGVIKGSYPKSDSIQASVPLDKLEQIAADPRVRSIRRPALPSTNRASKVTAPGADAVSGQPMSPRLQRFESAVKKALVAYSDAKTCCGAGVIANSGVRESQGDVTHRANNARVAFNVNGAGLRIGVLSDSFNNLGGASADVLSGDLPGPGNPDGFLTPVTLIGSGDCSASNCADEGRAMLQIVHDLAPGAILYYATAFNSDADFANNIRALAGLPVTAPPFGIATPGCDIIIDDISYSTESGLHDGQNVPSDANIAIIVQAVNDAAAAGVLYFSAAANSGNVVQGTSGAWEGDFVAGATPAVIGYGTALEWNGTAVGNPLTASAPYVDMQWSDPINGACNDYDFFLLDAGMTNVLAFSTTVQDCTNDPFEELYTGVDFPAGTNLVVVLSAADPMIPGATSLPRFISTTSNRGQTLYNTNGATRGHNAPASGFGIAATPAAATFGPPTPDGPFPGPFVSTNQIEEFSSDGPRRAFFNPDLSAITPGNFLAGTNGGIVRQKPDFTAADGVDTTLPPATGLNPFYGTSAAAPHAGAIAALVKQAAGPSATPAQIRAYLTSTALDIMAAGVDDASGAGILQAFQAVQATGIAGTAALDSGTITVTRTPAPGPILPGDSATVIVQLINNGAAAATGVSATLTTSTPCITIGTATSAYPDIAVGASANNATPFAFSLSPSCQCPVQIDFTLTITYAGGSSTVKFSVQTGPAPVVIGGSMDGTAPTGLPVGYSFLSTTQNTRLSRDATPSSCAVPKTFPGLLGGAGTRRVEAYTFTTPTTAPNFCISVTLDNATATQLATAAYVNGFTPADLSVDYAADSGNSVPPLAEATYSFTAPSSALVTIVVNDVAVGASGSTPYTLTIGGLCGVAQPVDVGVTAFSPGATVTPGTNATYGYTVTETSPSAASAANVTFSHTLPAGLTFVSQTPPAGWSCVTPAVGAGGTISCNVATLPPSSVNFSITALVPGATPPGNVPATGTVTTASVDSNPANDSLTGNIVVGALPPGADLSVTNVAAPVGVAPGANVTYTVNVTNAGPGAAATTSLSIPLSASTTFVSLTSPGGWACVTPAVGATGTVTCTNPSLAVSGPIPFTLVAQANAGLAGGTALTAVATVSSATADGTPGNNTASATSTVIQTSFTGPLATGGTGTVSFTGGGAGCTFINPQFVSVATVPAAPPAGVVFPFGLFQFSVQGCTVGSTVTLTLNLPGAIAAGGTYYKYGPTAGNPVAHWYSLLTPIAGSTIAFAITDGGTGDDDLLANGTIVDQGGPGQPGAPAGNPALVPTLDPRALIALMLLLGAGGLFFLRGRPNMRR